MITFDDSGMIVITKHPATFVKYYSEPPIEADIGDIYMDSSSQVLQMFTAQGWQPVYPDPGYMEAGKTHPANCKNCGAVLHGYICEYCGTDNLNVRRDE